MIKSLMENTLSRGRNLLVITSPTFNSIIDMILQIPWKTAMRQMLIVILKLVKTQNNFQYYYAP
jgi:hypothetical protein